MDSFSEQLISKTETTSDRMKRLFILAGGVVMTFALLYVTFFITAFAVVAAAGAVWGTWYLLTSTFIEYEYIVCNEYLDIDKIIAKRKRVNMLSIEIREIVEFGDYDDDMPDFPGVTVMAVGGDSPLKYAAVKSERYGETLLVFAPNEKTLGNIELHLNKKLKWNR